MRFGALCFTVERTIAMTDGEKMIRERLMKLADPKYREFQSKLMPTVRKETVIGVRMPEIRKLAKELNGTEASQEFLRSPKHTYYDENTLHISLINLEKDFNRALAETEAFLPYIDNWAVCDMLNPKVFSKNTDCLYRKILLWIKSDAPYTVRFGIGMLMGYFLDERFDDKYLKLVSEIKSDEYYVNMMSAWFFATALTKQYDNTLPYFTEKLLNPWVHNKAISKACDSFRVSKEKKEHLKTLRIK